MEHKIFLQVAGFIILLLGFVLTYNPELVSSKPIPEDTFQAVERRVRWDFNLVPDGGGVYKLINKGFDK